MTDFRGLGVGCRKQPLPESGGACVTRRSLRRRVRRAPLVGPKGRALLLWLLALVVVEAVGRAGRAGRREGDERHEEGRPGVRHRHADLAKDTIE